MCQYPSALLLLHVELDTGAERIRPVGGEKLTGEMLFLLHFPQRSPLSTMSCTEEMRDAL